MYNCHKLILNGRLFGIFGSFIDAEFVMYGLKEYAAQDEEAIEVEIVPAYIPNIGF